jgi:hypothetical protein
MGADDLVERFSAVLPAVNPVGHRRGLRRTRTGAIPRRFQAIAGDAREPRRRVPPRGARVRRTGVEQGHWLVTCAVHHDGPSALALPLGPLLAPDGRQRRDDRQGQPAHPPQPRVPTGRSPEARRAPGARLPAEGHAERLQGGEPPLGLARLGSDARGYRRGEQAARPARSPAHQVPHRELDSDRAYAPGQVPQVAVVAAMDGR